MDVDCQSSFMSATPIRGGSRGYRFVPKLATIWREKEILSSVFSSARYDVPSEQERDTINCAEYE